jgi:hypothetical protein
VTDFRIVATSAAGAEFTFTPANSTWATPPLGRYVSVSVIPASVSLSALQGSLPDSRNVFLVALAYDGVAQPNLRLTRDSLTYRPPGFSTLVSDAVGPALRRATRRP